MPNSSGPAYARGDTTYSTQGKNLWRVTHVIRTVSKSYLPADEEALQRGTAVHQACRFYDEDGPDFEKHLSAPLDPTLRPRLEAWIRFRRELDFRPLVIEKPVFVKQLGYAGTPDRYGCFGKTPVLVDIKTGRAHRHDTPLQMIAYAAGVSEQPIARVAVELKPDGRYNLVEYKIADWYRHWRAWLGMLSYFNYLQTEERR